MKNGIDPITLRKITLQTLILLGVMFGVIAWTQRPEGAMVWLAGMLTLPAAWALVTATGALPGPEKPDERRTIYNSLVGAGLLVTGGLIVTAATTLETIPEDWSTRFGMTASALVLIVIGNGLPKRIEPGCSRSRGLAIQRLLGWTFRHHRSGSSSCLAQRPHGIRRDCRPYRLRHRHRIYVHRRGSDPKSRRQRLNSRNLTSAAPKDSN